MSKSSPAFKRAMLIYETAKACGAGREDLAVLWQAVMRALHDTPEPPGKVYMADWPGETVVKDAATLAPEPPVGSMVTMNLAGKVVAEPVATFMGIPLVKGGNNPVIAAAAEALFGNPPSIDDDFDRMMREG